MPSKTLICRSLIGVGILLYVAAMAIAVIGTQGLFGVAPDGLAAVWLIFLGIPWSLFLSVATLFGLPVIVGQIAVAVFPILNLYLIWRLCHGRRDKA